MTLKFTSVPSKRLAQSITASSMTFRLSDIEGWGGVDLTSADFGTEAYGVFRNDANTEIEFFKWDPSTVADDEITITLRGLQYDGDLTTEVTANKKTWVKNVTLVELGTNPAQFYQHLKEYIDDGLNAGASDGSATVKGIFEEATEAEIDADTAAGGTGARLAVNPSTLATSKYGTQLPSGDEKDALAGGGDFGTPSADNKFITEERFAVEPLTYGETIAVNDLVYLAQDGKVYKTIATGATTLTNVMGFAKEAGVADDTGRVQVRGIVEGLSGLTTGENYYATDTAGEIGGYGSYTLRIGTAQSTSTLLLNTGTIQTRTASDTLQHSNDAVVENGGSSTYVKIKEVQIASPMQSIRAKIDVFPPGAGSYSQNYIQFRVNGVAVYTSDGGLGTYSFDITSVSRDDLVQVYYKWSGDSRGNFQNFRLYYDVTDVAFSAGEEDHTNILE